MGVSLNQIAEEVAFSLGDQFNMTLRELIKNNIVYYREKLLREEDFNSGLNRNDFEQTVILELEDYTDALGNKHKRTKNNLPESIRFKSRGRVRYNYVGGELMNEPFNLTDLVEYEYIKNLPFQQVKSYYVIEDNKVRILNEIKRCKIAVRGVFSNPRDLVNICDNVEDVNDNADFPLSGDLIAIIKKGILSGDFPIRQLGEDEIIKSNSEKETNL